MQLLSLLYSCGWWVRQHLTDSTSRRVWRCLSSTLHASLPLSCAGYNVPDWANWEDDPGAYETDPYTADPIQAQSKPWFPYNPADANSEDEFSDHEAEVDISDIQIPGERTRRSHLSTVMRMLHT